MEAGKGVTEKKGANEVVLQISGSEEGFRAAKETSSDTKISQIGSSSNGSKKANFELTELQVENSTFAGFGSPEAVSRPSSATNKPPKIPTEPISRPQSLGRSTFSKPKSRLVEPPPPIDQKVFKEKPQGKSNTSSPYRNSPNAASPNRVKPTTPKEAQKSNPVTPRTPLIGAPGGEDDEDDDVYRTANLKVSQKTQKKFSVILMIEWLAFVGIVGFLIASLTAHRFQNKFIWGLEMWKWYVLVLVVICGRLLTDWCINVLVFLIERNFLLKKKVLYFVYGLKRSVQIFIWLGLVLLAWGLLFDHGNLFMKMLSSSFQCTKYFDRIQESIFHQYVLRTLSGPSTMAMEEKVGRTPSGLLSFRKLTMEKGYGKQMGQEEVIDVEKLKKMKQERVSAWTMKGLINVIRTSGLSTISNTLDYEEDEDEQKDKEINSEWEAKAAAYRIFHNVAKSDSKYIDEEDLLRFMKKEEVDLVFTMFEGARETGKIKRKSLKNWLVNVYLERKSLLHSLNDTKTAIEELNRLVSVILVVVIIIVWLLLMGFLTTQILVFISSQLLLVVFMFGNTVKTVFEAIIFVFVMHPFDVGDRCVVDGVQMVVEEMNILTTIFLRYDNEKIFYPNSVLATKPISNFYRSPEMGDAVEFAVDFSTSIETIGALKARVKTYLDSKPQHWRPAHSVVVKDIEDVNKMKIALYVTHTINFQNYGDKTSRRSELVLEMKKIFEELGIKYHLLSQQVHISYAGSATSSLPPTWQ
ncbi:hypothetical protein UlMin_021996 [Ulmus minor]